MNLNIKATNTTATPAIKQFIEEKLSSLEKFLRPEDKIRVELEVSKKHHTGLVHRAEIDIQPHGYYADSRGVDFYAAMDLVMPKIKEQLVKQKDKKVSERRKVKRLGKGA
ncbi:MAG: ribosome-associated translation inhibitor RaiA [Candidatus Doudnabacteria bacterium]|nr:ribosome-associated translation inhibitor RaiA [Candidatus Doudnabacteria bacterium]